MENLSSAPNNDLLNDAEVSADSTPASITRMMCSKVFGGILDVFDPYFLVVVCNLAYAAKQQSACSLRSIEAVRESLREMLLMVSYLPFSSIIFN